MYATCVWPGKYYLIKLCSVLFRRRQVHRIWHAHGIVLVVRPECFIAFFSGDFFIKPRIGGGNKNKMTETCTMSGEINIK